MALLLLISSVVKGCALKSAMAPFSFTTRRYCSHNSCKLIGVSHRQRVVPYGKSLSTMSILPSGIRFISSRQSPHNSVVPGDTQNHIHNNRFFVLLSGPSFRTGLALLLHIRCISVYCSLPHTGLFHPLAKIPAAGFLSCARRIHCNQCGCTGFLF